MKDPTLTVLVLLGLAAVAAGFADAVVGGGGLIQLPALLGASTSPPPSSAPGNESARDRLRLDSDAVDGSCGPTW